MERRSIFKIGHWHNWKYNKKRNQKHQLRR